MLRRHEEEHKRNNYILLAEKFYLDGNKEKAIGFYNKALKFDKNKEDDMTLIVIYFKDSFNCDFVPPSVIRT